MFGFFLFSIEHFAALYIFEINIFVCTSVNLGCLLLNSIVHPNINVNFNSVLILC